jgi:hypothetical protein
VSKNASMSACDTCEGRIRFHNRPGVDSTMGLVDIGLGIHWRLTLLPPLPAPPSYLNPRSFLPPTHPRLNLPRPPRTRTRANAFILRAQTPREVSLFPLLFVLVSVCITSGRARGRWCIISPSSMSSWLSFNPYTCWALGTIPWCEGIIWRMNACACG